ncbi:cobaltochelatase subunit CobN [Methanococcoides alaskense]|uniref:Cobaltochelatase CobN n=1 Tax=Methanococcoides alaskense TaxID=325778 RepID=A0AA90U1Z8_9EURY|nr:cobaltochelatase subunit CobN [Methanococcoides alaskense]MDA0524166.1 cobaltochelatase subunit CobN [Methanococcoides alaskense]MDR6223843.1 cobaltochelatase CobN [Methanococcoides alaskense]
MQNIKHQLLLLSVLILLALSPVVSADENQTNVMFVLGTDVNEASLITMSSHPNITSNLTVTIFNSTETVPAGFNFSNYSVIFLESQSEGAVNDWQANLTSNLTIAKDNGCSVIGYNLSSNITLPNVDLYTNDYTDVERYWIQGGDTNMESMLKFMGQEFCNAWANETIPEPVILQSKQKITYIINSDTSRYYLSQVLSERSVITDNFNVTVMSGTEAANLSDVSDQDVIMLYMIGANELPEFKDELLAAKASGSQIGLFGMSDVYGIGTIDMENAPHSAMKDYLYNSGYTNMENWVRCIGATLEDVYVEYSAPAAPSIPDHGIYHPGAFPRVFENSTEYLEWYVSNGYNASAPTIGVIASYNIEKTTLLHTTDDAIINNLESKGYNVIFSTYKVCTNDVDYFTQNGTVLVDSIISLKGFSLNYGDQEKGVEYLEGYGVPVIKGVLDYYQGPDQFNESLHGMDPSSIPSHVTQPEIDGLIDFIWVAGRVTDPISQQKYYEPQMQQLDWMCDRAISWAELGHVSNANKKVTIIYYNHEGGKNNIGASYLDVGSSFTLLLEQMRTAGYDVGNGTIPNGSEFIDRFIESRNVGSWAPGELEKVVNSGNVTLVPVDEYLAWYNTLPQSVQDEIEARWGEAPGNIMVYENKFVIPTVQLGNINFIPQPTRGDLSDESVMYHDKSLPPTHQYLATYFWINNVYDADAMIHFGTHGTQEWLPGKEVGLWKYDYPSIMVADTPVVYPYIMDNVGEGTQAKRRGNAVIIDHMIPPITDAELYGELATMHDTMHSYEDSASSNDTAMMALYRNSTIQLYENLSMENDLNVTAGELRAMPEVDFANFASDTLHDYLHQLQGTLMPLGLHTFGVAPQDEKLVTMVKSMLRSAFIDHIVDVIPHVGDEEDWTDTAESYATELLNATLLNGTNVSTAQLNVLNLTDANITSDLNLALNYSSALGNTSREITQTLYALNGGYIEPGSGNDPIRNPDALPTGRNFYSFDQRKFPDVETTTMGAILANQLVQQYHDTHNNTYPNKVAYVLWSTETMRHRGLMEAQIYSLLGVNPTRSYGRITGFEVLPRNDTNPRIDVVITPSGLYRDTFPYQLELIDKAVRTVAALNESNETNYVRYNSLIMEDALLASGYNNTTAQALSQSRIFTESPGSYGTGLPGAVTASETWDSDDELADLYMSRMSNIYGQDIWGENYEDVFRMNLMDVDAAIHSDTTNLYGLIDNDDFYQYLGGLGLAVRSLTGDNPEMYIADLKNVDNPQIITLNEAFRTELRARYFNPKWIEGMMEYDYAGAREFMKFTEHMWGWDATTPGLVKDSDWNEIYDIYVDDKYDLGMEEFFNDNPYQYQSMTARMLETARKDYWDASDETLQNLVKEYAESVVENGVTCCHHTCGNPLLDSYIQGVMSIPGVVSQETIDEYNKLMQEATQRETSSSASSTRSSSSGTTASASIVNTTSTSSVDGGYGTTTEQATESSQQNTPDNYVEGYEMTKESTTSDSSSSSTSFSGADILGSVLVILAVSVIFIGFRRRGV